MLRSKCRVFSVALLMNGLIVAAATTSLAPTCKGSSLSLRGFDSSKDFDTLPNDPDVGQPANVLTASCCDDATTNSSSTCYGGFILATKDLSLADVHSTTIDLSPIEKRRIKRLLSTLTQIDHSIIK